MRICMIIRQFPQNESMVLGSGFEIQAYYLSRALAELGVEIHVLTERKNKPSTDFLNKICVHRFPKFFTQAGVIGCLGYNFSEGMWIQRLLKEYKADLIHSHAPITGISFLRSRKMLDQPIVVTFHGTATGEANAIDLSRGFTLKDLLNKYVNFRLQRIVDQYTCKEADKVATVSRATALDISCGYGIPLEKIEVIPNGIDTERFARKGESSELRKKLKLGDGPVVLYVGRLVYPKGITYLLKAIPEILRKVNAAKFVIVGKGPLEGSIREYAVKRQIASAITFLKDVPHEKMPEIYAASDILVLPSLNEASPLVLLEALASEICVVATSVGGVPEIIEHEKTGVLISPKDIGALEVSINFLIEHDGIRARLARNGRKFVTANYSWEKVASKYMTLYRSLVD